MQSLRMLFEKRREELKADPRLESELIKNIEDYPPVIKTMIAEGFPSILTSIRNTVNKLF